jgi:PPOX class probable F420-dependent enzyme
MSEAEVRAFLMTDPPHTGKLATTRQDGSPHVAPVWYVLDHNGDILFNTGADTLKGRTLRRDPLAAMCVDDERPPFSFVIVNGAVELIDDLAQVRHWAGVIGGRYMGADQAEAYGERNGVPGELLVRLHPERTVSELDLAE